MELQELLGKYKSDEEAVFNTWFINNGLLRRICG